MPYLTAGDPDLNTTARLLDALATNGADIIELGVPFSDPMADGPVIEAAMGRALAHGVTFADVLGVVRSFRKIHADTPIVLFGYTNPIHAYGLEAAARDAAEAGADGFLVVDLPPEESAQLVTPLHAHGLDFIALFTPTSDDARVDTIARNASGFAYYVSMGGVTGDALKDLDTVAIRAKSVRARSGLPVCVGFGIREPEDAVRVAAFADGVVVGTRIVQTIADAASPDAAVEAITKLTRRFREALDSV
ncbi:MAG: tryptophan synthase alpha chain [Myxococcota bacterium]